MTESIIYSAFNTSKALMSSAINELKVEKVYNIVVIWNAYFETLYKYYFCSWLIVRAVIK